MKEASAIEILPATWSSPDGLLAFLEAVPVAMLVADETGCIRTANLRAAELFGYERADFVGLSIEDLVPEKFRAQHHRHRNAFTRRPQARTMGSGIDLAGLRRNGQTFPMEAGLNSLHHGAERLVLASIIDLSAQKKVEAELEARVRERTAELARRQRVAAGLRDTLAVLNSERSLDEILVHLVSQAMALLEAEACAVYRYHAADGRLTVRSQQGLSPSLAEAVTRISDGTCAARAIVDGAPYTVEDLAARGREVGASHAPHARQLMADGYRALLAVPLCPRNRETYGALELCYAEPRQFDEEERKLALTLAEHAALAIENARLRSHAARAAVTAERNRIARDLHDSVTQTLFAATMIAEVLPKLWERDAAEGRRRLDEMRRLNRGAMAEMRTLLFELRPRSMAEVPLSDLLMQLGEAASGRAQLPVEVSVADAEALGFVAKETLYRVAQEALNNVAKHARAGEASLVVAADPDRPDILVLTVRDDGQGFDPQAIPADHLGLSIMAERAEAMGAELSILTGKGRGTTIELRLPMQAMRQANDGFVDHPAEEGQGED